MKHIAIRENHLYSKAYTKGSKYVARGVIVYVLKDLRAKKLMLENPQKKFVNRLGLTVSKKIGKAVIRTRVKRILREGLRQIEQEYDVKKGNLVVLVARPQATEMKSTEIAHDIKKAFFALGLI